MENGSIEARHHEGAFMGRPSRHLGGRGEVGKKGRTGGPVGLVALVALVAALLAPHQSAAAAERLDINTASVEQLTELPGIGEAKATAIVDERGRTRFQSVEELERVKGIGPGLLADLRPYVKVSKARAD